MEKVLFNKCQTPLEELKLDSYPKEVQEQFWDYINNVPFIRWMVSPERPLISEVSRDEYGRAIIDITRPPILEGSDYFRQAAITWQETGKYTPLKPNVNPNSEFGQWFMEEKKRGWNGFVNPATGMWVTGDYYWMLNYCPMHMVKKRADGFSMRIMALPKFWDGQFLSSHYFYQARLKKHHAAELSSRGRGKTTLGGAMLTKRFEIGEFPEHAREGKVQCYVTAADRAKLMNPNQILTVFVDNIDFIAKNTQFDSRRLKSSNQEMIWKMGYKKSGSDVEYGSGNTVTGVLTGVNQDKLNGSRGVLYIVEEAGIFKDLKSMYNMIRPSVEEGEDVYSEIVLYGCVCAGTKVLDENGIEQSIEDIKLGDRLLGYDGEKVSTEDITYIQDEAYKECVRITTSKGRTLECSIDHPLLTLVKKRGYKYTSCAFYKAEELEVGMTLLMPKTIGRFGNIHEPDAFLLGALFGDGNYSNNSCVSLSISTEEEYEYYNSRYSIGISKLSKSSNTYAQLYFRSMHSLLQKYKMDKQSFEHKQLPYNIELWDKESLCEFLSGYFNADGNVKIDHKKHRNIRLTCKYKNILEQVQHLLNKIGIISHIYEEHKPERILNSKVNQKEYLMPANVEYTLYISNSKDVLTFRDNLHFIIKSKQERLDSYIAPLRPEGYYESLDFVLRENGKGKYFVGKKIKDLKAVTIKKIEKIGKQRIYNLTANTTHTYITNGFISSNTAGDEQSNFQDFQEMLYAPDGYNLYGLDNVFDKEGQGSSKFCMFYGAYMNYDQSCIDKDGNSDITKALLNICNDRYKVKYGSSDINTLTQRISQYPITPQEAILRSHGNVFPVTELNERLNQLDNNPNEFDDVYVGELIQKKDGTVEFQPTVDIPIRDFPTKDNKVVGALEIYEMPQKNSEGKVPYDRYGFGLDPFDDDQSGTMSLGSVFVMDFWTDRIVAEYTGRPMFANDLYEKVRLLCLYYNMKGLYENNLKGIFSYFSTHNCTYMLEDTPEYLKDRQLVTSIGFGNKSKGVRATTPIIKAGFRMIRDWLLKPVTRIEKDAEGNDIEVTVPNLYNIRCRALLKELIQWNPYGNYDRIMALVQVMLYREEKMIIYQGNMNKRDIEVNGIAADDYWKKNYPGKNKNLYNGGRNLY